MKTTRRGFLRLLGIGAAVPVAVTVAARLPKAGVMAPSEVNAGARELYASDSVDLTDIIYDVSPTDMPFIKTVRPIPHEWQTAMLKAAKPPGSV